MKVTSLILVAGFKVKALLFGIILLSITSCVTQKACLEKFPIVEQHDTLIVYRDTIIQVPVLGTDTVYKYGTIRDTVYASAGTAHSYSYVIKDTLKLVVWQSDTILSFRCDSLIKEITIKDTEIATLQQGCEKGKGERFLDKLIILVAVLLGGTLIIYLIKLFK